MRRPGTRQEVKQIVIDVLCYTIGSLLYAVAVNCFIVPNDIAPGGVTGVAAMIRYTVPSAPIGLTILLLNVPLLIAAWWLIGRSFAVRTVICTGLSTVVMDMLAPIVWPYRGDMFLVAVVGGVLSGVGLGLIFCRGGSTGGTEVAARLLERRFPYMPVGRLMLMVDAVVIIASAFVFGRIESALYAVVLTFVTSSVVDTLVYGNNGGKLVMIFSSKHEELADEILGKLNRGVTKLHGRGGYSGEERDVLLCAVRRTQVYALRRLVAVVDPSAFIVITTAQEVLGEGFGANK